MKLENELIIEQSQKLTITPELIQAIKILQYSSQELEDYVKDELLDNPILEIDESQPEKDVSSVEFEEEKESDDFIEQVTNAEYDDISYSQWSHSEKEQEVSFENFVTKPETLIDSLLNQLTFSKLKGLDKKIGKYFIEACDDNGYISVKVKEVAKIFNVDTERVGAILDYIQTFEPSGVLARTLEESLIIQLANKGLLEDSIEYVILHHLEDIANNRMAIISKATGLSISDVQLISDLIKTLDPKPGSNYASESSIKYIIPDVIIERNGQSFIIFSNDSNLPRLTTSDYYLNMLNDNSNTEETVQYINDKYNSAQWLIKSIEQRKQTIVNVTISIVNHQKEFFEKGVRYLKPLTLKEVATDVNIHESTVSRSVNGKYAETPYGMFELKYFFTSGVSTILGEGVSSNSIKEQIKELIKFEDPKHPISDQYIVDTLVRRGIEISRRTVTKYREAMNILSSSKRRRY